MATNRAEGVITMCKRAGMLVAGFDVVKKASIDGKLSCVCTAADLSPKSNKELLFICEQYNIPVLQLELTMDELWYLLGKRTGILGVTDKGFADKLNGLLNNKR